MADAALPQIAGTALARLHGNGGLCGALRHVAGCVQRSVDRQMLFAGLPQRVGDRQPDIAHGFIARLRLAAADDAVCAFPNHQIELVEREALSRLSSLCGTNKEGAKQRPAGAADVRQQHHAGVFKNKTNVFVGNRRQFFDDFAKTAVHVEAVIGVAYLAVQAGQKVTLGGENFAAAIQPVDNVFSVQ